jgi:type VI secretion system protein VasD
MKSREKIMFSLRMIYSGCLVLSILFIASCSTVNTKVGGALNLDTDLKLEIIVDSDINPDESGTPSPLFIRLYELKATKLFDRADFITLYENDKKAIGADLVAKQELKRLAPGKNTIEHFVLSKDTQYVALYAEFYQYKDAKYKVVFPISASNLVRNSIKVKISANNLVLLK